MGVILEFSFQTTTTSWFIITITSNNSFVFSLHDRINSIAFIVEKNQSSIILSR